MADTPKRPYLITDGDTVRDPVTGVRTRLAGGANTPEIPHEPGDAYEPGGNAATDALDSAVNTLGYRPDASGEHDKFGRELQPFTGPGNTDLSAGLIGAGLAVPHINPNYLDKGVGLAQHSETAAQLTSGTHSPLMQDVDIRLAAQEARNERVTAFNQWVKGGAGLDSSGFMGEARDLKWNKDYLAGNDAIMDRALARGTDNFQGMYFGFANALGEVIGSDKVAQYGADGMARNMLQAMENPATIASYEDIESYADFFVYAAEAIGEQVPQLAADLGVAAATMGGSLGVQALAGAGKAALRSMGGSLAASAAPKMAAGGWITASQAGKLGAAGSMYAQLVGETQMQFKQEGVDNPELALALGVPKAALDYVGFSTILSQGLKGIGTKALTPDSAAKLLGNASQAAGIAATTESLTEGAQILIDELALTTQKEGYEVNAKNIIEGMLKGGIAGGGISGGANLAVNSARYMSQLGDQNTAGGDPLPVVDPAQDFPLPVGITEQPAAQAEQPVPVAEQPVPTAEQPEAPQPAELTEPTAEQPAPITEDSPAADRASVLELAAQPLADEIPLVSTPVREEFVSEAKPAREVDQQGLVEEARRFGVDTSRFLNDEPVTDEAVARRELFLNLDTVPEGSNQRLKDLLGGKRIENLTFHEVQVLRERLGLNDKPVRIATVKKDGQQSPMIEQQYRQQTATAIKERVVEAFRGVGKFGMNLAPMAELLGVPADSLQRSGYANDKKAVAFRSAVNKVLRERFGSVEAMATELAQQDVGTLHSLAKQLGVKTPLGFEPVPATERKLDIDGVRAALRQRQPTRDKAPVAPEFQDKREAKPAGPVEQKAQQVAEVARDWPALFDKVGEAVNSLGAMGMRDQVIRRINGIVGATGTNHRHAVVEAVRDAMLMRKSRDTRRTVMEIEGDGIQPVEVAEGAEQFLDVDEQETLDLLADYRIGRPKDTTDGALKTVLHALRYLADDDTGVALDEEAELRINRAYLLTATIKGLLPSGVALKPFAPLIREAAGLDDSHVQAPGNPDMSAEDVVTAMFDQVKPYESRALARIVALIRLADPVYESMLKEMHKGGEGTDLKALAEQDLRDNLQADGIEQVHALANIRWALGKMSGGGVFDISSLQEEHTALGLDEEPEVDTEYDANLRIMEAIFGSNEQEQVPEEARAGRMARDSYDNVLLDEETPDDSFGEEESAERKGLSVRADGATDAPVQKDDNARLSDVAFFGALQRAQDPVDAYTPDNAHTQALQRRNIAVLKYTLHGFERIGMFDMVALATYSQKGERAPATAAEAATNLLENLGKAMEGPQTTAVEYPIIFDVTAIPPDNVVIWVDPVTGEGVTYGEAMGKRTERTKANATVSELEKERAALSNKATIHGDLLADLSVGLTGAMGEATGDRKLAYQHWLEVLDGKRKKDIKMLPAVEREFNDIGKTTRPTQKAIRDAVGGFPELAPKDITLKGVMLEQLTTLTRLGKVSDQLKATGAPYLYDGDADIDYFKDELQGDRDLPEYINDRALDDPSVARALEETARSGKRGMRTSEDPREVADAPMPNLNSRAPALKYPDAGELAAASRAKAQVVINLAIKGQGLEAGPGAINEQPLRGAPTTEVKQHEQKLAPEPKKPLGLGKAKRRETLTALLDSKELPQDDDETGKVRPAAWRPRVIGKLSMVENGFIQELVKQGVPLSSVTVAVEPSVQELLDGVGESSARYGIKRGYEQGGSFYLRTEKGPLIVLRGATGDERLIELAHELGHAVKDEVWQDLKTEQREALEAAFKRDYPDAPADETLMHEWFADQFAQAALDNAAERLWNDENPLLRAIGEAAWWVKQIWETLTGRVRGIAPEFTDFARSLFSGSYATAIGRPTDSRLGWQPLFASGADQLADTQAKSAVARIAGQAKSRWKTGAIPQTGRRLFKMVISRIKDVNPTLAGMLFQQAGAEAGASGRSYQHRARALHGRMAGQMNTVLAEIQEGVKGKNAKKLAVRMAFNDAMSGRPISEPGRKVRALLDGLARMAVADGLRSVPLEQGHAIAVFNRETVDKRRAEFEKLLTEKLGENANVTDIVERILDGGGVMEGAVAPGLPVGTHASTKAILEKIPFAELQAGGWLLEEHDAALYHWIDGVSKRTAWEAVFGDYVDGQDHNAVARRTFGRDDPDGSLLRGAGLMDEDNRVFSPNAKYHQQMDAIKAEHGNEAARDVQQMIDGALGRHGRQMPRGLRKVNDFITSWMSLTVLAFSGIASIPELAMPLVRGGGKVNLGEVFRDLGHARRFARDMGIVLSDTAEQVVWQSMGEQYQSPLMQKITHQFFKWNQNKRIVDMARTLSVSVAMRYLQTSSEQGDHGALQRLNIDAATVQAWIEAGRPTWSPDLPLAQRGPAKAVADAVNQFVSEATLNPSRFQATDWGNNPYLKFIWQLKHFLYTYGDTVLGGIWRETHRRWGQKQGVDPAQLAFVAAPMILFGVFVLPLAAASIESRDWIRRMNGQQKRAQKYDSALDESLSYTSDLFMRAGGFGPWEVLRSMEQQAEWGMNPILGISPTVSRIAGLFDPDLKGEAKVRSLIPVVSQNKGLWPFD